MATAQQIAELSVPITGDPRQLDAALKRAETRMRAFNQQLGRTPAGSGRSSGAASTGPAQAAPDAKAYDRAAASALALARAQAAGAAAAGNHARAEEILQQALHGSTANALKQQGALNQLEAVQRKAAGGAKSLTDEVGKIGGGLAGARDAILGLGGAIGIGFGIDALVGFTSAAVQSGNELEKIQATVRAVAGDQGTYNEVLALAAKNQQLLGGSLAANLGPLQQFLFISNRTGAELSELNNVAQLLATVNPFEGIEGAGFALSEALSGDLTSIVERFNLPRQAVRELINESSSAGETLRGITALLAEQGVTMETLAAATNTNAASYDRLGASLSNVTAQFGQFVAAGLAPAADGLNAVLTGNEQVKTAFDQQSASILAGAASYDEYLAKVQALNAAVQQGAGGGQLDPAVAGALGPAADSIELLIAGYAAMGAQIAVLTPQQFALSQALIAGGVAATEANAAAQGLSTTQAAYAQSLIASGVAASVAVAQAAALTTTIDAYSSALGQASKLGPEAAAGITALEQSILTTAAASETGRVGVEELLLAFSDGVIGVEELRAGLEALAISEQTTAAASNEAAAAALVATAADTDRAEAAAFAAAANEAAAVAARDAGIAAQENAAGELLATASAQELAQAKIDLQEAAQEAALKLLGAGNAGAVTAAQLARSSSQVDQLTAAYYRLAAAQQAAATGGGAVGSALKGVSGGAAAETAALRSRIKSLDNFGGRPVGGSRGGGGGSARSGGGGSSAPSEAEKAAEKQAKAEEALKQKLLDINERYYEESAKAEEAYQERILDIQAAYAEKQKQAQEDLVVSSKKSRFDFYSELTSSDVPQDVQQQLSAAYEAAFAEAQRLSQEGKAALAADYLALKQEQLAAELEYQQKLAAAREKGDKAEIARLEALNRLRLEAEQAELDQLLAEGDQNTAQRDEDLADADKKRQEDLAEAAAKVGDATAEAQNKGRTATDLQNVSLQEQLDLLDQIAARGGAASGPRAPTSGAAPGAVPGTTAPSTAAATLNGASPGGAPTPVADAAVAAAIEQLRAATANGLAGVERAVSKINNRPNYGPGG